MKIFSGIFWFIIGFGIGIALIILFILFNWEKFIKIMENRKNGKRK